MYFDPGVYGMMQKKIYTNHINALDNLQDVAGVVSLVEAILNCIKIILTYITKVVLHSEIRDLIKMSLCRSSFTLSSTQLYSSFRNTFTQRQDLVNSLLMGNLRQ